MEIGNHYISHISQLSILGSYLGGMELSHCLNARIFSLELLKLLFDNVITDLVFVRIISLDLLKVLFDNGINNLVLVICVPLELTYLVLDLGYLLGLVLLCLKKIPCVTE